MYFLGLFLSFFGRFLVVFRSFFWIINLLFFLLMVNAKGALMGAMDELKRVVEENPCGMSAALFGVVAACVMGLCSFFRKKRFLSADEAARLMGVSTRTLRRRVQQGVIPAPKHYGHWEVAFRREDIEEYLEKEKTKG